MKLAYTLSELSKQNQVLKENIDHIPLRFRNTDKSILESLTKLSYILFVKDDLRNAALVTDTLAVIDYVNDYDYWTWVEYALALRAEIAGIQNQESKRIASVTRITDALACGEGLQKKIKIAVHNRFMAGEGITLDALIMAGDSVQAADEFNQRVIFLMALIKLKSLGASAEYPMEKVCQNIAENLKRMFVLIDGGVVAGIQPFN